MVPAWAETAVSGSADRASPAELTSLPPLELEPLSAEEWSETAARHLLSRAGFGGTPEQVSALASLRPDNAVEFMVDGAKRRFPLPDFEHSGVFEPGLDPFPPSRPAATNQAQREGEAMGVKVRPGGPRPLQPVVNRFFYWLRASRLETDRVAYWWANRMLNSDHPLQEKMALFWHGHFATNEDKVRDYRKMLQQLELFQQAGLGDFRALLIAVAQNPAMLVFLDAGVNTKNAPNENFAREIMELFSMGTGHYTERDVQEAARAFTGWNVNNLQFVVNEEDHDTLEKTVLGQQGAFDGVEVIDLIMAQPATAQFIASKLYRYFVTEELADQHGHQLGQLLREVEFDIAAFLKVLFASRHFYEPAVVGSRIKSPVELAVSTYKRLELDRVPGNPDFNVLTGRLGQRLLHPPTVAGWSQGRSWITPSLLFERSNFVLDVLFPDLGFVPPDRYPVYTPEIVNVQNRLRAGMNVSAATQPTGVAQDAEMAASNMLADADEAFNTRLGSMRGWQMAVERVLPISRHVAGISLTQQALSRDVRTVAELMDFWEALFFNVKLDSSVKAQVGRALTAELGTHDLQAAATYAEDALRQALHQLLSLPDYQLG